jgi:hypothetical protein
MYQFSKKMAGFQKLNGGALKAFSRLIRFQTLADSIFVHA